VTAVLLVAWLALVCLLTIPWTSYVGHPHWYNVQWVPFAGRVRAYDVVANVLLYMPLGFLLSRPARSSRRDALIALALGVGLSIGIEWTQVYSHARVPSVTDVIANGAGAWLGVAVARATAARGAQA
jgi:glycopeptide antibiotics resistance protein